MIKKSCVNILEYIEKKNKKVQQMKLSRVQKKKKEKCFKANSNKIDIPATLPGPSQKQEGSLNVA